MSDNVAWYLELRDGRWPIVPTAKELRFNEDLLCEVSDNPYEVLAEYVHNWEMHGCSGPRPFLVMETH